MSGMCSWRFWAQVPGKKDNIVCGVVRQSSDKIGRPYPLIIVGTGVLGSCWKKWDLLPSGLDNLWQRMETLAAGRAADVRFFEDELKCIPSPSETWQETVLHSKHEPFAQSVLKGLSSELKGILQNGVYLLKQRGAASFPLEDLIAARRALGNQNPLYGRSMEASAVSHTDMVTVLHRYLKQALPSTMPCSVFLGGSLTSSLVYVFFRAITPEDFLNMWMNS